MNASIILDFLLAQNSGETLHFDYETFPLSILKEAILRGLQVRHFGETGDLYYYGIQEREKCGFRRYYGGAGNSTGSGYGYGLGVGYGIASYLNDFISNFGFGKSSGTFIDLNLFPDLARCRSLIKPSDFRADFGGIITDEGYWISKSENKENVGYYIS